MNRALVLAALLASGCGGDGDQRPPDAGIDGPPDAPPDAPPPAFVGMWERQPFDDDPNAPAPIVTFEANGTYRDDQGAGSWKLVGSQLEIVHADGRDELADFYVSGDARTLLTFAMRPISTTSGLIGTWRGRYQVVANTPVEATFEFRSDSSVTWTETRPTGTRTDVGGWTLAGTSASLSFTLGTTPVQIGVRVIPDVALGDVKYERYP